MGDGRRYTTGQGQGQDTGRATLSGELGKGDAQYFIFHAHLHSCTHTASPHSSHLECFDVAMWAWPAARPCGQRNNGKSNRATKATARHVIKRKRCLWPHVVSSCCRSVSIFAIALAWRMSSVAAAPAASYLQPLEGSVFCRAASSGRSRRKRKRRATLLVLVRPLHGAGSI